jgi:hypothetical protein
MPLILLAILASLGLTAGWWLKSEKQKQIDEKKLLQKIAEGSLDDEVKQLLKNRRKVKRKRSPAVVRNGFTVELVVPTGAMLSNWLVELSGVVDKLLPAVHAYRTADQACQRALKEKQEAEGAVDSLKISTRPQTEDELQNWFSAIQSAYIKAQEKSKRAAELEKEKHTLFLAANRAMSYFTITYSALDQWDLYKAPEEFHEKVELATLLKNELRVHSERSQPGADNEASGVDAYGQKSWRKGGSSSPNLEPAKDDKIALHAVERLTESLPSLARLLSSAKIALTSETLLLQSQAPVALLRPASPAKPDVDALIETALKWAGDYQNAQTEHSLAVRQVRADLSVYKAELAQLQSLGIEIDKAELPAEHLPLRKAFQKALSLLESVISWEKQTIRSQDGIAAVIPDTSSVPEAQEFTDAAANLQSLVQKLANCLAQLQAAASSYEGASGAAVEMLQFNSPTLGQTGAMAFVNAHLRMAEITARNKERAAQHQVKVAQLFQQLQERRQLVRDAMSRLSLSSSHWREKYAACTEPHPSLDRMLKVAWLMQKCFQEQN